MKWDIKAIIRGGRTILNIYYILPLWPHVAFNDTAVTIARGGRTVNFTLTVKLKQPI